MSDEKEVKKAEETARQAEARIAGNEFLSHLRASNLPDHNDETIGTSNNTDKHRRDVSSLSDLFESHSHDSNGGVTSPGKIQPSERKQLPPRPPPMHNRNRSVSWGNSSMINMPHLQQPNLDDSLGTCSPQTQPRFHVDDLLSSGPYEQEVETNILRALEERQALRARADTGTSTILSGVPDTDNMAHDFTLSPSVDGDSKDTGSRTSTEKAALPESREQTRPLLTSSQRKNHRRTMSVEQTLAGLTSAMSALDHAHVPTTVVEEEDVAVSSADQFAQNAALLTPHDEGTSSRLPTAKDRWNHLLDNLPTLKETEERGEWEDTGRDSDESEEEKDVETGEPVTLEIPSPPQKGKKGPRGSMVLRKSVNAANDKLKEEWDAWTTFFQPRKEHVWSYIKLVLCYLIIPLSGIAAILYYGTSNPPTGVYSDGRSGDKASASWWLLFVVRQIITFSMSLFMQMLIVDFLALGTKIILRLLGPILTLLIVQSKGWPMVLLWFTIFDFAMLYGDSRFAKHWLFWQEAIGLFNEKNPSGNVVNSEWNMRILTMAITVSAAVGVKRFLIGLYLGRQTYAHYGQKLARVMSKMLFVSEVANLAKAIEKSSKNKQIVFPILSENFGQEHLEGLAFPPNDDDDSTAGASHRRESSAGPGMDHVIDMRNRDPLTGSLHGSEKMKIMQLLERWEEPDRYFNHQHDEVASISAVLRFRNALALMQKDYPFSYAFGPADTREACIESAQKVYNRLLLRTPGENILQFLTIALLALQKDGTIDQQKAKDLVKLFRPDREGNLTMLDFLKSTDAVYKEFRLLQASIQNSSRIDQSLERILNWIFYTIVVAIILAALGLDPLAIFLSLSSVILGFAFMIGSASSKYFEGLLFILVRRPYNIGDFINVSNTEQQTSFDGSPGWVVENVTLFETVARWLPTNEQASLSNGSLASSRIINWARSPNAQFHIFLNFPINTPYDKILIFKRAVEEYMKARPREWLALNGFRANRIHPEKGYVEYVVVVQHREGWQSVGQVLDSKANLSSYCMEVSKQLGLTYRAPPLPVDLTYSKAVPVPTDTVSLEKDDEARLQDFRSIVHQHNIRVC